MMHGRRLLARAALAVSLVGTVTMVAPVPASAQTASLVIEEIHYNPSGSTDPGEFLDIMNTGSTSVDLAGFVIDAGTPFTIAGSMSIGPGQIVSVTDDATSFRTEYGFEPDIVIGSGLSNGGETLTLRSSDGQIVDSVTYDDQAPWPDEPDGEGASLQLGAVGADNSMASSWSFGTPAPGNRTSPAPRLTFDPPRGWFGPGVATAVTITSSDPGATIRYTTNADQPGSNSSSYQGPISLNGNTEVEVIRATATNAAGSAGLETHTYVFRADDGSSRVSLNRDSTIDPAAGEGETVMSFEFIPSPSTGLVPAQAMTGLKMSTGGSTQGSEVVTFRNEYGDSRLNADLFGDAWFGEVAPTTSIDQLMLRRRHQDTTHLLHAMGMDSTAAVSGVGPHGRYVLMHQDGENLGTRYMLERPEAGYMTEYYGGDKADWAAASHGRTPEWDVAVAAAETNYETFKEWFDPVAHADYHLLGWLASSQINAQYRVAGPVAKNVPEGARWLIFGWDQDGIWDQRWSTPTGLNEWIKPSATFHPLNYHPEYKRIFADRIHCAYYDDGPLTPDAFAERLQFRADEKDIIEPVDQADVDSLNEYVAKRSPWLVARFKTRGFTPDTEAVTYSTVGGLTTITNPNSASSVVYYTIDGTDPMDPDGTPSDTAIEMTPGALSLPPGRTIVTARVYDSAASNTFERWSATCPKAVDNASAALPLVLNELHYNPPMVGAADGDLYEYVEIYNPSMASISLAGVSLSEGVNYTFGAGDEIAPGGYVVLASDSGAYQDQYGVAPWGTYEGQLANSGETVTLSDANGVVVETVTYDDLEPWPTAADGTGASLSRYDNEAPAELASSWRAADPTPAGATRVAGDASCDVVLDLDDAWMAAQLLTGVRTDHQDCPLPDPATQANGSAADVDGDNNVTAADVEQILVCLIGGSCP